MTAETERSMLDRLNIRYGRTYRNGGYVGREFARAEHVPNGAGWNRSRIADYLAVHMFRTTGHEHLPYPARTEAWRADPREPSTTLIGHEVKVSRSDWLAELRDPEKADAWKRHCHAWYLVVPDAAIVRGDLPADWGLLVKHGRSLKMVVRAPRLTPEPLPFDLVAALTRSVMTTEARVQLTQGTPPL